MDLFHVSVTYILPENPLEAINMIANGHSVAHINQQRNEPPKSDALTNALIG
jgi:hypothetical protein